MPCLPRLLSLLCTLATTLVASLAVGAGSASAADYRGVQLHSLWGDSTNADMDRELDMTRDMGANVVRVDVGWQTLEQGGKGVYSQWYVDKLDRFMAAASARGLKVIATLMLTPCWASSAPDSLKQNCSDGWWDRGVGQYTPTHASDFGDISRWMTGRYGGQLAALELWNEPNLTGFFQASDPAASYAELVKAGYVGAKQGNASVPVLAAALSLADTPFLNRLYDHGIKGYYDGISVHPYNAQRDPATAIDPQAARYTFQAGLQLVRQTQLAHGDSSPIWATEFGWSTCAGGSTSCVSEAQQAAYTPKAFAMLASMSYVKAGIVYNLRDTGTDPVGIEPNYGLINRDYTPKPAYASLKAFFTSAAGIPAASTPPVALALPRPRSATPRRLHHRRARISALALDARVHIHVFRAGGRDWASGQAPAHALLRVTVSRVRYSRSGRRIVVRRHVHAHASSTGRFLRCLGRLSPSRRYSVDAVIVG